MLRNGVGRHLNLYIMLGFLFCLPGLSIMAQEQATLYAGLIKSKGYVVGSPLSASGLHRFAGDTSWTHIGWNHPRISGIAYDPSDPDVLFLAGGNGVLRTTNGGQSWKITTGWEVTEAQDIDVDPNTPEQIYVATAYGVWRTTDGGETWTEATAGLPKKYTQTVEVDRARAGRVLIGTWGGLYLSEDGGRTWTLVGPADVPVLDLQQSTQAPDVWLAGTQDRGVLLSRDGGQTWQIATGDIAEKSIYAVAIDPFDPEHMAAAGWDTGVFVTRDGGRTWTARREALPVSHVYEVVFDANDPGRLWAATLEKGIFHTDGQGDTWRYAGLDGTLVFDMVFIQPRE